MCLKSILELSYAILRKEGFSFMEEIQEISSPAGPKRQMTVYSPEMKLSLLNEYKAVAGNISIAKFVREHDLCLATFYGWMKKAGIKAPPPPKMAVDVRSMIPIQEVPSMNAIPQPVPLKKQEPKPVMIPIVLNGNELMTTPEGIGVIISSLKKCSR